MASITSLGIGSGLDLTGLLDNLREAEQQKLVPIQQQVESEQAKVSAYGQLKGGLSQLQTAASALNNADLYESLTTSVEGDGVRAVTSEDTQPGQYEVDVEQLATAGSLATERLAAPDEAIIDGDTELTFAFSDSDMSLITIADGSSLENIRDAINTESDGRLSASIINDGEGYRLSVNATETGANASIQSTNFSDILADDVATSDSQVVQEGLDALVNVNGIDIVSSSNQIEGAIQGVTLDLNEANISNTITVAQDSQAINEGVKAFVEAFNTLKGTIGDLTAFDAASGQAGQLNGDRFSRTEARIDETVERHRVQFAQLDTMMSQMNSTGNYLTQQLACLNQQQTQG